jgi:hypothetical protein
MYAKCALDREKKASGICCLDTPLQKIASSRLGSTSHLGYTQKEQSKESKQ